ncbi:DUF4349 domain-containing protein [Microbacterium sp. 10M-3C3]|uniref:DUF4349 domain-containing protein n=1 Tax=Microbacterium sp. 10M-3C3 TaxID=2483401 RepID=UPI000F62EC7A|nr:DUF4349 domain-containing protein [Microbacterium sp. 10M-3C3]
MNTAPPLPELDDVRIARIERDVFARIASDRRRTRTRRTRAWSLVGAAAAIVVVAAVIAPGVTSSLGGAGGSSAESAAAPDFGARDTAAGAAPEGFVGGADATSMQGDAAAAPTDGREIVTTGSAALTVDDVAAAARRIAADAESRGGYVESQSIGGGDVVPFDGAVSAPYPGSRDGWITVRVPSDALTAAMDALADLGEVTSTSVSRQDVTDQAVDLRARIAASEASVARLTELMAQAGSVADLIAAESALSERQASLDADRQQLALLEGQIDLSALSVQLTPRTETVAADPAGFGDGVVAGWNGLVAAVNGIVVAIGFLLPWVAVVAAAAAVVWSIVRLVRVVGMRRRRRASGTE